MYDNSFTSGLSEHLLQSQVHTALRKAFNAIGTTSPPVSDDSVLLDRDENVTMMTHGDIHMSPQILDITPPEPASPTTSDADSECLDDGFDSASSFTGEECPDLCGGPKDSCRSWTPPASPFYYTDEGGIFLMDDRQNYEERQKVELEHTLRDLEGRLQQLRVTMSPPRFLSRLDELENMPVPPSTEFSERLPWSPTEELSENSTLTTITPQPCPSDCDGIQQCCTYDPSENACAKSPRVTTSTQRKDKKGIMDLGRLLHTSLQRVQTTKSLPKYLACASDIRARPLLKIAIPKPHGDPRDKALSMGQAAPRLRSGKTAYPTPLPSSPETKPSRKRGRDEGCRESGSRKRLREEDGAWSLTH